PGVGQPLLPDPLAGPVGSLVDVEDHLVRDGGVLPHALQAELQVRKVVPGRDDDREARACHRFRRMALDAWRAGVHRRSLAGAGVGRALEISLPALQLTDAAPDLNWAELLTSSCGGCCGHRSPPLMSS